MFILGEFVKYEEMSGVVKYAGTHYITIDISVNQNTIIGGVHILVYVDEYNKVITSKQSDK